MEIIQAVRGGTIKITGIVFTDRDVTITDRGKPFTAPIGKSPIELSSLEKMNFDNAKWLLGIVWAQYCTLVRKGVPQDENISLEAEEKAQEALGIDNATMLNIKTLNMKWREEDERIAEEKQKEELAKEPERALARKRFDEERTRLLTAAYIARHRTSSD